MESALYGIYALVVFVSEILLVRFLIRQQLVRKYRTPALSMKYSLFESIVFLSHSVKKIVTGTLSLPGECSSKLSTSLIARS